MARALARGWNRPLLVADPAPSGHRRWPLRLEGRRWLRMSRWPNVLTSSCSATSRPAPARRRRGGAARQGDRLDPRGHLPCGAPRGLPRAAGLSLYPSLPVEVRRGALSRLCPRSDMHWMRRSVSCSASSARSSRSPTRSSTWQWADVLCPAMLRSSPRRRSTRACAADPAAQSAELVVQTLAGTAELLRRRGNDTLAVRREVASPGGVTARGLAALERAGCARPSAMPRRRARQPMILASARTDIAEYLSTLIYVYTLLIILYIVIQLLFSVGLRPPYSRVTDIVMGSCATSASRPAHLPPADPLVRRNRSQPAPRDHHSGDPQRHRRSGFHPRLSPGMRIR